jgi:hypothetical protein
MYLIFNNVCFKVLSYKSTKCVFIKTLKLFNSIKTFFSQELNTLFVVLFACEGVGQGTVCIKCFSVWYKNKCTSGNAFIRQ